MFLFYISWTLKIKTQRRCILFVLIKWVSKHSYTSVNNSITTIRKKNPNMTWLFFISSSVIMWAPVEMEMKNSLQREQPPLAFALWSLVSQPHSTFSHLSHCPHNEPRSFQNRAETAGSGYSPTTQGVSQVFHHLKAWLRQEVLIDCTSGSTGQTATFVFIYPSGWNWTAASALDNLSQSAESENRNNERSVKVQRLLSEPLVSFPALRGRESSSLHCPRQITRLKHDSKSCTSHTLSYSPLTYFFL